MWDLVKRGLTAAICAGWLVRQDRDEKCVLVLILHELVGGHDVSSEMDETVWTEEGEHERDCIETSKRNG